MEVRRASSGDKTALAVQLKEQMGIDQKRTRNCRLHFLEIRSVPNIKILQDNIRIG
jgi:hypothetical protein